MRSSYVASLLASVASISGFLLVATAPFACSVTTTPANPDGDAGEADGGDASADAAGPPKVLSFKAANLPSPFTFKSTNDVTVSGDCTIDTDAGSSDCWDASDVDFQTLQQLSFEAGPVSTPDLAIFSMGTLKVSQDAQVTVKGARALVLVTYGDMDISGSIDVSADVDTGGSGGFSGAKDGNTAGRGFAPGGAPDGSKHGGGGGALCGAGGNATGGKQAYAATANFPLFGGSSGGSGYQSGGGGGGAIELVIGGVFNFEQQAVVRANGGGPSFGGGGGGSGGMIVVEAYVLNNFGTLLANGGGGSANNSDGDVSAAAGTNGSPNSTPAPGGTGTNAGGAGSGGATLAGADGKYDMAPGGTLGDYSGGGGGGAGIIRVRYHEGGVTNGTQSPSGACYANVPDAF